MSLFLRSLLFTLLAPGVVAGLLPYLILKGNMMIPGPLGISHYAAIIIFIFGFTVLIHCIIGFAVKGRGTLLPMDPTKHLVISGFYKYSRNPMYVGVISMLVSESLFSGSSDLWIYTLIVFTGFNLFIFLIEEPRLRRDFGEEYDQYRKNVRRWL